jgi:uncharacterized protein YfdQ (DUF2303 family)
MDSTAIEKIREGATVEAMQSALDKVQTSDPLIAAPSEFKIHDLEEFMPGRSRYRGSMSTSSPDDYVRYCCDHDSIGAKCFVDPESMSARAFFNLGTEDDPGHADFTASLKLDKTAEYRALCQVNGDRMTQKTLAEWLEDWSFMIQPFNGEGDTVDVKKAISAVRRITIEAHRKEDHEDQDFKASRSALESVEARSDSGLPSGFIFTCVPYNGLGERSFECRLSVITGGDTPKLVVRIKRLDVIQEDMGKEFMQLLSDSFEDWELTTYLGSFSA